MGGLGRSFSGHFGGLLSLFISWVAAPNFVCPTRVTSPPHLPQYAHILPPSFWIDTCRVQRPGTLPLSVAARSGIGHDVDWHTVCTKIVARWNLCFLMAWALLVAGVGIIGSFRGGFSSFKRDSPYLCTSEFT